MSSIDMVTGLIYLYRFDRLCSFSEQVATYANTMPNGRTVTPTRTSSIGLIMAAAET